MKLIILSDYDHRRHGGDPARRWDAVEVDDKVAERLLAHGAARRPEHYRVDPITGEPLPPAKANPSKT